MGIIERGGGRVCVPCLPTGLSYIPESREARGFFQAGKNCEGYFDNEDLVQQTDRAINIFESKTKCFTTGLWLFDNPPSHQKRPANGLSARKCQRSPTKVGKEWSCNVQHHIHSFPSTPHTPR